MKLEELEEVDQSDFRTWLQNPITQIMLLGFEERNEAVSSALVSEQDFRPEGMNRTLYYKGILTVYREIKAYDYAAFNDNRTIYIEAKQNDVKTDTSRHNNSG